MVKLLGEVESVKFGVGRGFTVRESVAVFVKLPEAPLMLTVTAPVVAVLLAVSVKVLVVVAGFGLNDAPTPLGRPEAVKLTLPLKPLRGVMVIVLEPLAPCVKVRLLGDVDSPKLGADVERGQLFTRFVALTVPMPVAKSQPTCVPYAGLNALLDVASTPTEPPPK
jgi:hypothetical protein